MFNTFKGGIHPPQRKALTENLAIENLSVPQICHIPMLQHTGTPAIPLVKKGDIIEEGQIIGEASGLISANVHASVPGKVIDIIESETVNGSQISVVIEAEGAFITTGSSSSVKDWNNTDKSELLGIVQNSGVVGLGGEAFPVSVKLTQNSGVSLDTLLINGAESEPYLTIDDLLMKTYPHEIIEGVQIALKIAGIKKAVIGVEDNKKQSIKALKNAIKSIRPQENITVKQLKTKYPQGAEHQLIYSILKRNVPSGGIPADIGAVVQNVGTILAIRDAVIYNKPLIERYLTVSGSLINRPGNYKVRIGTKISDIVEECGGLKNAPAKIIIGGPMRGVSIDSMDIPVVKSTSGILFLSDDESYSGYYDDCIRCGRCVSVCPAGLIPCDIAAAAEKEKFDLAAKLHVNSCIMCSSCSYVCPAKRPISHFIRIAQESLSHQK